MELTRSLTSTVYVVYNDQVLLHMHKKFKSLFPVGGHLLSHELPEEAAIREVYEEAGLQIKLYNNQKDLGMTRVKQLNNPQYTLLENIGKEVENIDFIYFAKTDCNKTMPLKGESKDLVWLTREEILSDCTIKEHIKVMALEALNVLGNKKE